MTEALGRLRTAVVKKMIVSAIRAGYTEATNIDP
jgi:hypothetical protein